ncbi:hypothetical protein RSOLAG22IIIB_09534 [Rhizoctonia solani]|uniref:RZ-type domain-containing protein n=1 Tax=Rhizoctonia solani TaxID=456999 RepID=A0A0K6FYU6_9AGAM|nr:hypothetical protein RSOLAG22IIIB_09534 [Rhizoctonia solani]
MATSALESVKENANNPVVTRPADGNVRQYANHAKSLVYGRVPMGNVRLLAERHAHDYPVMRNVQKHSIADILVHQFVASHELHSGNTEGNVTLDSMTITLPCRHVFTVKALDSITRVHDFYDRDSRGRWSNLTLPNASNVCIRPVCPHCGGEIDSLRYGRILKYFNHSVLQHNISRSLSERLSQAENMLSGIHNNIEETIMDTVCSFGTRGIPAPSDAVRQKSLQQIDAAVEAEKDQPTSLHLAQNLSKFHGFPPRHTKAWRKAMEGVTEPYLVAYNVTRECDPSVKGYNALFARFYHDELNRSGGTSAPTIDPTQQRLQQLASEAAHIRIGHPRPRASERFVVEAFWISIEIMMLLGLSVSRACEITQQQPADDANTICWENVAEFLLLRASKDAEKALDLARISESHTTIVKCQLLVLQTQYELAAHKCLTAGRNGRLLNPEYRQEYLSICNRGIEQIQNLRVSVPRDYQGSVQPGAMRSTTVMRAEWTREYFSDPSKKTLEAWVNLYHLVHDEIPGRRQEETAAKRLWRPVVQKAAASNRKWHTQHFYRCAKGHPYTRGECAVAFGKLWCPDCGEMVGDQV